MEKFIIKLKKMIASLYYNERLNDGVPIYKTRKSKAKAVYKKYKHALTGKILDVGADELYLKKYLPTSAEYTGIGLGNNPDLIKFDLEKSKFPFKNNSFDTVLCLDVLEHVDNIHEVFDELCRVSSKWVIISLPNPWAELFATIRQKRFSKHKLTKFYGLPPEREPDRHKWFFASSEALKFIEYRSKKNKFAIKEIKITNDTKNLPFLIMVKLKLAKMLLFRKDLELNDLYSHTIWWLLEKKS